MTHWKVYASALAAVIGLGGFASPANSAVLAMSRPYLRATKPKPVAVNSAPDGPFRPASPPMTYGEFLRLLEEKKNEAATAEVPEPAADGAAEEKQQSPDTADLSADAESVGVERSQTLSVDPVFIQHDGLFDGHVSQIVTIAEILPLFIPREHPGTLGLPPPDKKELKPVPFQPPNATGIAEPFSEPVPNTGKGK